MLKINPGQPTVWLRPDTLQIGLDAEAVIVGGLSPAHQRFIRALQSGISESQINPIARSTRVGGAEARSLIERLGPVMLEAPGTAEKTKGRTALSILRGAHPDFAELIRFALATNNDGTQAMANRANRVIHIENLDRTGITLLRALAAVGFAQFWSGDRALVSDSDTISVGFDKDQLGQARFEAAAKIADRFAEETALVDVSSLRPRVLERVDCAILIGTGAIEPKRSERWLRLGIPHIAITFDHSGVRVSPMITPNKTPCLNCKELSVFATDANHALRVMQLVKATQKYDDASAVLFASAMVVAALTEAMDSIAGFDYRQFERIGWQFERASGRVLKLDWPSEPSCGCGRVELGSASA